MIGVFALLAAASVWASAKTRERAPSFAQIVLDAGREGCAVDLDSSPLGSTDAKGILVAREIVPFDHYVHVRCGEQPELSYFVSVAPGENLELVAKPEEGAAAAPSPLEAAESRIELRRHVQQAVQFRAQGRFEEAVQLLRKATKLDAANSDLHRELGITFLLAKDWKRGRVEMIEALRYDRDNADAHNGLGYALEKLGQIETALKEYHIAAQLEPDNFSFRQHYLEAIGKLAARQQLEKKK